VPGGVARLTLRGDRWSDWPVLGAEEVCVSEDLAERETELSFLVSLGKALDLGDDNRVPIFPGEVEHGLAWKRRSRYQPRNAYGAG
jgi:hypothetical protein